jgi:hypothetical protein
MSQQYVHITLCPLPLLSTENYRNESISVNYISRGTRKRALHSTAAVLHVRGVYQQSVSATVSPSAVAVRYSHSLWLWQGQGQGRWLSAVNILPQAFRGKESEMRPLLYSTVMPYHTVTYCDIPYHTIPYCDIPWHVRNTLHRITEIIAAQHSTDTTSYRTVQHSTHSTAPYSAVQYSTIPYSTIPYSTAHRCSDRERENNCDQKRRDGKSICYLLVWFGLFLLVAK